MTFALCFSELLAKPRVISPYIRSSEVGAYRKSRPFSSKFTSYSLQRTYLVLPGANPADGIMTPHSSVGHIILVYGSSLFWSDHFRSRYGSSQEICDRQGVSSDKPNGEKYSPFEVRIRAVQAILRGVNVPAVATAYGTHRSTIFRWVARY